MFPELVIHIGAGKTGSTSIQFALRRNAAILAALKDKTVIDSLALQGLLTVGSTPEEMARSQREQTERWKPLINRIGFTAES